MMVNKFVLCVGIGLFYSMGFTNEVLWDFGVVITRAEIQNVKEVPHLLSSKEKKTIVIFGSLYLVGDILSKN